MKKILTFVTLGLLASTSPALAKNGHSKHDRMEHRTSETNARWDSRRAAYEGDGRGYWYQGRYYRDGRLYGASCPRGLVKKNNGCLPPGHARSRWQAGQRLPQAYRDDYVPNAYRDRYSGGTYRYADGYVYQVDPRTYVIQRVISAVLR